MRQPRRFARDLCPGLALFCLCLVAGSSALAHADSTSSLELTRISGPSPFGLCLNGNYGSNYPNAEVEPWVAANPASVGTSHVNLVAVWQQDRWVDGGAHGIVAGSSFDGGLTWTEVSLPFSSCSVGGLQYDAASDPWVSIGPDGTVYAVALVFNNSSGRLLSQGVAAATSRDGGKSWGNVQTIVNDTCCNLSDKESVTTDPTRPGVAYLVWDRSRTVNGAFVQPAWFSKTTDGGKTWSSPRIIAARNRQTLAHQLVVDPRTGALYDFFSRGFKQSCSGRCTEHWVSDVCFIRSSNAGKTWSAVRSIARYRAVGGGSELGTPIRTGEGIPAPAIDPATGRLYIAWQDARFSHGHYDDIVLSTSGDGGAHWSPPRRVNPGTGRPAVTPSIAVSSSGVVAIAYYDFRNPALQSWTLPADYWLAWSDNHGKSFSHEIQVAGPIDFLTAPWSQGFFLGDYQGLAVTGSTFHPVFVATNNGDLSNRTDVFAASITPK